MVRPNKGADAIAEREGAEVVAGDFNDLKSIADALKGMDRAFLLTSSSRVRVHPIECLRTATS